MSTRELLVAARRVIPADEPAGGADIGASGRGPAGGYVLIRDGRVVAVGRGQPPRTADVHLDTGVLTPGFVDLQVNGAFGVELPAVRPAEWRLVARRLPETGTTAFLPTFVTAPLPALADALRAVAGRRPAGDGAPGRARILGVHLEGPFLSPHRVGAHNADWLATPTPTAVAELIDVGGDRIRLVTLAPELPGALGAVRRFTAAGVAVSVGHSDATGAQVSAAAEAGARMVTHLFNAQRGWHHREPGVTGQALADRRFVCTLIADLHHVAEPVCRIVFAAAPGRICLVTDATAAVGMPPGRYRLGGGPIELPAEPGTPPARADGTLAGSALTMDVAVANMARAGVGLPAAVAAASRVPADVLGRADLGRLAPGAAADLVWLDDDLRVRATWIGGELAYRRGSRPGRLRAGRVE